MKSASGDLKKIIDAVDESLMTSTSAASIIRAKLLKAYPGILDFPLPKLSMKRFTAI